MHKLPRGIFFWLLLLTAVATLLATACQAAPTATPTKAPAPAAATPTTAAPPAAATATKPPAAAAAKQDFRLNIGGEPQSIDPNRSAWDTSITIIRQVFVPLLGFNKDLSLKAAVAKEIPSTANGGISADGKTYTFKLRNDVKWSDGKPVTAKDFAYSIKRLMDPKLAAEYASFYYDIVGAEELNTAKPDSPDLAKLTGALGVKAVDDTTLEITLKNPRPTFLQVMALDWPVVPIRQDMVEKGGDKWTDSPDTYIGNGPFMLKEWKHQDHITLVPNPNWWGDPKPKLTSITWVMITDAAAARASYEAGELDMVAVPSPDIPKVLADANLSKQTVRINELVTFGVRYNVKEKPFDNVKLRQAFQTAFDGKTFVEKVLNLGKPALSWIPPGMPGYNADLGKEWAFNPTKAKQLLSDAGFADPKTVPPIKLQFADTGNNKLYAQFIQAQLKDNLAVAIDLDPMEPKSFSTLVNAKKHQWAWFGWGADYPDPDNWLPEIWGTKGGNNKTNYSSAQFDEIAAKAAAELDEAKRLKLWDDAQKIVIADLPSLFTHYRERLVFVKPYVQGLTPTAMDGHCPGDRFFYTMSIAPH